MDHEPREASTAELEVFIPGPGQNPHDESDTERTLFLETAQRLLDDGLDIAVYSTDSYPSAFTECIPVAEQIEIAGLSVLPILLVDGVVKVSYSYPDAEQMQRFSRARSVPAKKSSTTAGCAPAGSARPPATVPRVEPAGFAATLAKVRQQPLGGPDIGNRPNLMSGDFGTGLRASTPTALTPPRQNTPDSGT